MAQKAKITGEKLTVKKESKDSFVNTTTEGTSTSQKPSPTAKKKINIAEDIAEQSEKIEGDSENKFPQRLEE